MVPPALRRINAFLRNKCDCSGDSQLSSCSGNNSVKVGAGNELDWARQLWDFQTNGGSTKPSWTHTLALMGFVSPLIDSTDAWDQWKYALQQKDAAWGTSFWSRWDSLDHLNGINFCQSGVDC